MLSPSLQILLLLCLSTSCLSRPNPCTPEECLARLEAFWAQKPLHTTALLAGAAVTAIPNGIEPKVRDLESVTGERGLWVKLEGRDEEDDMVGDGGERHTGDEIVIVAEGSKRAWIGWLMGIRSCGCWRFRPGWSIKVYPRPGPDYDA